MADEAQVGDTVRLTMTTVGVVEKWRGGALIVNGRGLIGGTVEILSRAIPPLPSEPGTWWLDNNPNGGDVWLVNNNGVLRCISDLGNYDAKDFAPFRQLVLK